uniref:Uncharacterized protein n=1 Tax=Anopheles arabiensis TaxID=7173 RepID=A0A182IFG4_ANOAR
MCSLTAARCVYCDGVVDCFLAYCCSRSIVLNTFLVLFVVEVLLLLRLWDCSVRFHLAHLVSHFLVHYSD